MVFLAFIILIILNAVTTGCLLARYYAFTGIREREVTVREYKLNKHGERCVSLWRPHRVFLPFCVEHVDIISFPDAAAYETVRREGPTKFIAVYEAKRFLFVTWEKYISLKEKM